MCVICGKEPGLLLCPSCGTEENFRALSLALLYGAEYDAFSPRITDFCAAHPGREERAALLRELCASFPEYPDGGWLLPMAYRLQGASARGEFIRRGTEALPSCEGEGYCRLGCALASALDEEYEYPEAIRLAGELKDEQDYLPARLVLADCYMKLHRLEDAISEAESGRIACMDVLQEREFSGEAEYRRTAELYRSFCRAEEDYQNRKRTGRQYVPMRPEGREKLAALLHTSPTALKQGNTRKHENALVLDFVAFDLETTGVGREDAITEIGAVKVRGGKIVDRYDTFVDPGFPIPPYITQITGITDEMVAGAPDFSAAVPDFLRFAEGLTLVAHNASFDMRFLMRDAARCGVDVTNSSSDTLRLARKKWPGLESYKLTALTERFSIRQTEAHRAWCDAEAAAELYLLIVGKER